MIKMAMVVGLRIVTTNPSSSFISRLPNTHLTSILSSEFRLLLSNEKKTRNPQSIEAVVMASGTTAKQQTPLTIDSHLHVWAAPQEVSRVRTQFSSLGFVICF